VEAVEHYTSYILVHTLRLQSTLPLSHEHEIPAFIRAKNQRFSHRPLQDTRKSLTIQISSANCALLTKSLEFNNQFMTAWRYQRHSGSQMNEVDQLRYHVPTPLTSIVRLESTKQKAKEESP
jgi:hypothetical protein